MSAPTSKTQRRAVVLAGALPLVVVVLAPVVASWHGLVAAGHSALGLTGAWAYLVPLVFDAAAAYAAVLALRSVLAGDSALVDRVLVWAYAAGSASLNIWHADATRGIAAAAFYGAASVSAVLLWDRTLRALRRSALHARGLVQLPAPHFRFARWAIRPKETARAWAYGVTEGVSSPVEALEGARTARELSKLSEAQVLAQFGEPEDFEEPDQVEPQPTTRRAKRTTTTPRSNYSIEGVQVGSKKEALALAFRALDSHDVEAARTWLAERGVEYSPSAAYRARNELAEADLDTDPEADSTDQDHNPVLHMVDTTTTTGDAA